MYRVLVGLAFIFFSINSYALDWSFGLEGATVLKEPAFGVWVSAGPILFGLKDNFAEDVDRNHGKAPSSWSYGPTADYLNDKNYGEKGVSSYNIDFDVMYLIDKESRLNVYIGGYVSKQKICPVYWTGDVNYLYNCPKWENKEESGMDFRIHYDIVRNGFWVLPLALSTNTGGDFSIGLGWKGKLW